MACESLLNCDWEEIVGRLGGAERLGKSARENKAFLRSREIKNAVDLLRLVLAYCLGAHGLRLTAAWAASVGLVDISNVALLKRLRGCGDWLGALVDQVLHAHVPKSLGDRVIRILDGTSVPKAGARAKKSNGLWRIHSAFDLFDERFSGFKLTDQTVGEAIDLIPVIQGEIRIADRAYLQADGIANVLAAGGDVIVRAGWKGARWRDARGKQFDLMAILEQAPGKVIDRPISIERKGGDNLHLRLVAIRKSELAAQAARRKARRGAQRGGHTISRATLLAAGWVILITSLPGKEIASDEVLALYRLRWRIELGFKRLKSIVGLSGPPGSDERSARSYLLAHLLMILLLEPLVDELEDSPPAPIAA